VGGLSILAFCGNHKNFDVTGSTTTHQYGSKKFQERGLAMKEVTFFLFDVLMGAGVAAILLKLILKIIVIFGFTLSTEVKIPPKTKRAKISLALLMGIFGILGIYIDISQYLTRLISAAVVGDPIAVIIALTVTIFSGAYLLSLFWTSEVNR